MTCFLTGDADGFSCDPSLSMPLCSGDMVACTYIAHANSSGTTVWKFLNGKECAIKVPQQCITPATINRTLTCGEHLNAAYNCSTSSLNITADISLNGLVIQCWDKSTDILVGNSNPHHSDRLACVCRSRPVLMPSMHSKWFC